MLIGKLFPTKLILGALALFLGYQAVVLTLPAPREFTETEKRAVQSAAETMADELERRIEGNPRLGIARFLKDSNDTVTETVRNEFTERSETGSWQVREGSVIANFLSDISSAVAGATTPDEVIHAGRRVGLDMVVGGRVQEVSGSRDEGRVVIRAVAYDFQEGRTTMNEIITGTWRGAPEVRDETVWSGLYPGLLGWLIWMGCILLLPRLTSVLIRKAMEQQSNTASAILLVAYTAGDAILGWLLVGFPFTMFGGAIGAAAVIILCGLYNYWISEKIAGDNG